MKKSLMLVLLALSLSAAAASASPGEWIGGVQGGVHIPSSDYGDRAKAGWVGGALLDYMLSDMVAVGAQVDFNSTKAKDEYVNAVNVLIAPDHVDDIKLTILNYGVHGNLYFMREGIVRPYVAATVGAYTSKIKTSGGTASGSTDNRTVMGFGGGVGIKFQSPGNPVGFGIEGTYQKVGEAFIKGGIDADFINVVGKVTFSFSDKSQAH